MQQVFGFKENNNIRINDNDLYHLKVVMRIKDGDEICVILDQKPYLCLFHPLKDDYDIEIVEELLRSPELKTKITLCQALIRNENFDLVLQKATELGVSKITPTVFKRNVVKITSDKEAQKQKRFESIVLGAANQSRRLVVPEVSQIENVKDLSLDDGELGLVAYEKYDGIKSFSELEPKIKSVDKIKIVVGPEGGITTDEYECLLKRGFIPVSLGNRILRSETATFNFLSILDYIIEMK